MVKSLNVGASPLAQAIASGVPMGSVISKAKPEPEIVLASLDIRPALSAIGQKENVAVALDILRQYLERSGLGKDLKPEDLERIKLATTHISQFGTKKDIRFFAQTICRFNFTSIGENINDSFCAFVRRLGRDASDELNVIIFDQTYFFSGRPYPPRGLLLTLLTEVAGIDAAPDLKEAYERFPALRDEIIDHTLRLLDNEKLRLNMTDKMQDVKEK